MRCVSRFGTVALLLLVSGVLACPSSVGPVDAGFKADADSGRAPVDAGDSGIVLPGRDDAGIDSGTLLSDAGVSGLPFAFVGGYSGGISVYRMSLDSGTLTFAHSVAADHPSFLALSPNHRFLYSVAEAASGQVQAFALDSSTGALKALGAASSEGTQPAHVSVDATGRWVLVANYGSGTVAVLPAYPDGGLGNSVSTKSPGANAHFIHTDATNAFAFVPCLGSDLVAQYLFNESTGALTENAVPTLGTDANAGPRHLAFHPTLPNAYLLDETASLVSTLALDRVQGRLTVKQTQTTLPVGFSGTNTGGEVQVHPNGKFVYASNRGANDLAIFKVSASDGMLTLSKHVVTGGATPRHFSIDPTGAYLYVANQGSNTVTGFRVNAETGDLTSLGKVADFTSPSFVQVFELTAP